MLPGRCGCWARFPSVQSFSLATLGVCGAQTPLFSRFFPSPSLPFNVTCPWVYPGVRVLRKPISQSPWLPACWWALFSKRSLRHCWALDSHCGQLVRPGTSLCSPPPPLRSTSSPSSTTLEHSSLTQAKAGFVKKLFPHECQCERVQLREWGLPCGSSRT